MAGVQEELERIWIPEELARTLPNIRTPEEFLPDGFRQKTNFFNDHKYNFFARNKLISHNSANIQKSRYYIFWNI